MQREIMHSETCLPQKSLEDLPKEVLMHIMEYLSSETLTVCVAAHPAFAAIILDEKFLDVHTRKVLGFPSNYTQITHSSVPDVVLPVQELCYQTYLAKAAPEMLSLIRPDGVFYNLLCFQHLLDSWFLQAGGFKFMHFTSYVTGNRLPPLPISRLREIVLDTKIRQCVTKMALCCPEILLKTISNFEVLSLTMMGPSDLDDPWTVGVPPTLKMDFTPRVSIEVVLQQKGLILASFLLAFDSTQCIGWAGLTDYSTFRCLDTWQACRFGIDSNLTETKKIFRNFFQQLLDYVGTEYVSVYCSSAFFYRGMCRLMQPRQMLLQKMQATLERTAARIGKKASANMTAEQGRELISFLDAVRFMPHVVDTTRHIRLPSKTLHVAIQRYLHRVLNSLLGSEVLRLYSDPVCHNALCTACSSTRFLHNSPAHSCLKHVGPQRLPLKIWPLHLIQLSVVILPALGKLVRLEIERWRRGLHNQPLSRKIKTFARCVLQTVNLNFDSELADCSSVVKCIHL